MAKTPDKKQKEKKKKMTAKEQSARFITTARELEADESGKSFEMVFEKIVPAQVRPKKPKP